MYIEEQRARNPVRKNATQNEYMLHSSQHPNQETSGINGIVASAAVAVAVHAVPVQPYSCTRVPGTRLSLEFRRQEIQFDVNSFIWLYIFCGI